MNIQTGVTLERLEGEIEAIVEANVDGGGWIGAFNERRYEHPDITDLEAWQMDGTSIELSETEREKCEEAVLEQAREKMGKP